MVSTSCHCTGRNSTVPPKGIPSVTSLEPLICLWEALLLQDRHTLPKIAIRRVGDTAYDSYISETLYPLKSAIKLRKQMRFAGDPVSSVKTIPARRTRSHPPKWTIKAGDPDLLIPIELSQARAESDLNQDLRGNLSVVSPSESHQSEETLPTVPLGQFQAQRSDNTTTNSIAHCASRYQHILPKRNIL